MKSIRLLSILLVFALLTGLYSCTANNTAKDSSSAEESQGVSSEASIDTSSEETSEDTEDEALAAFEAATEALDGKTDLKLTVNAISKRTIGQDVLEIATKRSEIYTGIGSDAPLVTVEDTTEYNGVKYDSEEIYSSGKAYYKFDESDMYYSDMSYEDFMACRLPAILIDKDLYGAVAFEEGNENVLIFTVPSALESWVAPEYGRLISADGRVELSAAGEIESMRYTVSYTQGPASYTEVYNVDYSEPGMFDSQSVPDDADCFEINDIEALKIIREATIATGGLISFSISASNEYYSEAGGVVLNYDTDFFGYGETKEEFIAKVDDVITYYDYNGETETYNVVDTYIDGTLTTVYDGTDTEVREYDPDTILEYMHGNILSPYYYGITSLELTDLGEYWYISYEMANEYGESYEDQAAYQLFGDEDTLDDLAESYKTDTIMGCATVDKDTLLLTAMSVEYMGTHTIDGEEYIIGIDAYASINIGSVSTYKEITGELPEEETEPEQKPTPLFYEVTAPDGGKMYMLGTIHIGDNSSAYLPEEIYNALYASDALAVEFDLVAFEEELETNEELMKTVGMSYYYSDGSTIDKHIDKELYEYASMLVFAAGIPSAWADYMHASAWSSVIDELYSSSDPTLSVEYGIDYRLIRLAKEKGIEVLSVETPESQYTMDAKFSDETKEFLLEGSLSVSRLESIEGIRELYTMWCEGHEETLIEYMKSEEIPEDATDEEIAAYEEYNKAMMTDRDAAMLDKAKEYMASGETVFFAVGLAHIIGETGLLNALRAEGYTVELVQYD